MLNVFFSTTGKCYESSCCGLSGCNTEGPIVDHSQYRV